MGPCSLTLLLAARALQRKLARELLEAWRREEPDDFLVRRLRRFVPGLSDDSGPHCLFVLRTVSQMRAPCITASLLKTWCNAWCPACRFQQSAAQCRFGCGQARGDRPEHYLRCPAYHEYIALSTPALLPQAPVDESEWLLAVSLDMTEVQRQAMAVHIYVVQSTFESFRSRHQWKSHAAAVHLLRRRLRLAWQLHAPVRSCLRQLRLPA